MCGVTHLPAAGAAAVTATARPVRRCATGSCAAATTAAQLHATGDPAGAAARGM